MSGEPSSLSHWTPGQVAAGRRWVQAWREAGETMERLRREELRRLDGERAVALLSGPAGYTVPPRAPRPASGLVEQQKWFKNATGRD